jgi:hypothetical protein
MPGRVAAGEKAAGTLVVRDAYGNPADPASVAVVSTSGREATVTAGEEGRLSVDYEAAKDESGALELEVRAGPDPLARAQVDVLPYQRRWSVIAGVFVAGATGAHAGELSPRVGLGLRLANTGFDVGVEGAYAYYPSRGGIATLDGAMDGTIENLSGWQVALALRYSLQLFARLSLHASVAGGVQISSSSVSASGADPRFPAVPGLNESRAGALLRGAAGTGLHVLGGRVVLQVEYSYVPIALSRLRGNIGGVGGALGYIASF